MAKGWCAILEALTLRLVGPQGRRVGVQMVLAVRGTVNGLVLVGMAEGVLLGIAYWLLGVPRPALFGGFTALSRLIPFGAPLIFAIASLVLLGQSGVLPAAILFGFGCAVVFVADHFVRPVLIGGAVKLPFLWVLLGILGGLEGFGLVGPVSRSRGDGGALLRCGANGWRRRARRRSPTRACRGNLLV